MSASRSEYLHQLLTTAELREHALRAAIEWLRFPEGSSGLDVGCGAGLQCMMLASAIGPEGRVTGVDPATEFLEHGRALIEEAGLASRITLKEGAAQSLPFENDTFDWAWSVDCVGYGPWDAAPMLEEIERVIRPGGELALLAWSSERLLPGHPLLEARLSATGPGLAPFRQDMPPEQHYPRTLGLLRGMGLTDLRAYTSAGTAHAPLSANTREALEALIEMRWPGVENELGEEDKAEYRRLCIPSSPDYILGHADYYAYFTYSVFAGRLPS
jgi:demethylmenaquinone methyltransferase/2-methoxy-6-polyprenyl-1,4-benzoquinol methylase